MPGSSLFFLIWLVKKIKCQYLYYFWSSTSVLSIPQTSFPPMSDAKSNDTNFIYDWLQERKTTHEAEPAFTAPFPHS